MPAKLSHLDLEISLSEVQEQMHPGVLCCTSRHERALAKSRGEASKGVNLALVQGSAECYLSSKLMYGAAYHKVPIKSGGLTSSLAFSTLLSSKVLFCQLD